MMGYTLEVISGRETKREKVVMPQKCNIKTDKGAYTSRMPYKTPVGVDIRQTNFQDDDVRFLESLVEHFLEQYTQKGDIVFDPFAGFGTTLFVAERLGRAPYGVEIDQDRVSFARGKLANTENIFHADVRSLSEIDLPEIDFSITSPP